MLAAVSLLVAVPLSVVQEPVVQEPKPLVATHYYYWYQWPKGNFNFDGTVPRAVHRHHFVEQEKADYLDPQWHGREFRDMAGAGVDIALPVYWGRPGEVQPSGFAKVGLPPMVEALDTLAAAGEQTVKLGLFYDTTTLGNWFQRLEPPEGKPDLTTEAGRKLFCDTIVSFFELVPKRHWARMNRGSLKGRPLVVLFTSGAAGSWDEGLSAAVRDAFWAAFPGEVPCVIADATWGDIGQDLTTEWGRSFVGPLIHEHAPGRINRGGGKAGRVAQIGPGFDASLLPDNKMATRDREGGAFYSWSWQRVLRAKPSLVILETWNEMHEASEICESLETGRLYLDLTRIWTERLVAGADPGPEIQLQHPELPPMRDMGWGEEAAESLSVRVDYGAQPVVRFGLREFSCVDGSVIVADGALRLTGEGGNYMYFQVSDHWRFDDDVVLEVQLRRTSGGPVWLEYDSHDPRGRKAGAYTATLPSDRVIGAQFVVETFRLSRARLANRQNCGTDFRLAIRGPDVAVFSVVITQIK